MALSTRNFDVVGVSETRLKGSYAKDYLTSSYKFFAHGSDSSQHSGTGFFVKSEIIDEVIQCVRISDRVSFIDLKTLKGRVLRIVQVYAPCCNHTDEEYETFLEDVAKILKGVVPEGASKPRRRPLTVAMGDWNARVGTQQIGEDLIGKFGYGDRNARGDQLMEFCLENELHVCDSFFKKRRNLLWSYRSDNGQRKTKIDYVLCAEDGLVKDVRVVSGFNFHSDHRLIMCRIDSKLRMKYKRQRVKTEINYDNIRGLLNLEGYEVAADKFEYLQTSLKTAIQEAREVSNPVQGISTILKSLFDLRHQLKSSNIPYANVHFVLANKMIRQQLDTERRERNIRYVEKAVAENKSIKKAMLKTRTQRNRFGVLLDEDGNVCYHKEGMQNIVKDAFEKIYTSTQPVRFRLVENDEEEFPEFTLSEIKLAIRKTRGGTTPGKDGIPIEAIKKDEERLAPILCTLFNEWVQNGEVPDKLADSLTILLYKKGDVRDITNYRPISLLSSLYKLFTKVMANRMSSVLDEAQTADQAGFRRKFCTTDHIFTVNHVIQNCKEYNIPLYMMFIDYRKAFDSIEYNAVWKSLQDQGVHWQLIRILMDIYGKGKNAILMNGEEVEINIEKGVRQGDTLSPILFTATLRSVFLKLKWEDKGLNINGERLSNLLFADDIVLFAQSKDELVEMARELEKASLKVGLQINASKTVAMTSEQDQIPINLRAGEVTFEGNFVYLGHKVAIPYDPSPEISRRIQCAWGAYAKHSMFLRDRNVHMKFKRKLFNMVILPCFVYGSETWALRKKDRQRLAVAQRKMERRMVGVTLMERKTNEWLKNVTKLKDVNVTAAQRKWNWALKVSSYPIERWPLRMCEWNPNGKRNPGRPMTRWRDDLTKQYGNTWMRVARQANENRRDLWKRGFTLHIEKISNE